MPNGRNDDPYPSDVSSISLSILDIIRYLGASKLVYLGDEIATEIIVRYNAEVDVAFYIEDKLNGMEIKELFNKLPNPVKVVMAKKVILSGELSKSFITQIIKNATDQYNFFIIDTELRGSLLNMFSIVVVVICIMVFMVYFESKPYRGTLDKTISDRIADAVVEYVTGSP